MIRKGRFYHQNHEIIFPIIKEKLEYKIERHPTREMYATPTTLIPFLIIKEAADTSLSDLFFLQVYISSLLALRSDDQGNNNIAYFCNPYLSIWILLASSLFGSLYFKIELVVSIYVLEYL